MKSKIIDWKFMIMFFRKPFRPHLLWCQCVTHLMLLEMVAILVMAKVINIWGDNLNLLN